MHELSIASSIVESVLEFAEGPPRRKVLKVLLQIGELTCVEPDQLKFCYMAITKETPIEDSTLEVERVDAEVFCRHFGYEGSPKYWDEALENTRVATLECPKCGKATEAGERGHECTIKTIRYVES
jgi:hydrogenase nickel incorporation protein HypA/HybF